ncbi:MAG TPA: S8 family serine peptidase, partial [Verrucomicrobiota bacterium]|nr:S8 family serine peptidase [Verrucomicrobiota bacterium]
RTAFVPDDPYVRSGAAWHLDRIGAPEAWNFTPGSRDIVVAVLDSGINPDLPEFAGQLLPGADFVWNDDDPRDDFGHGTAVAGVIAAAGHNGVGVAGVAFGTRILPVKVADASGFAAYSAIARGIDFAVAAGARVINISISGTAPSLTLQEAVNRAWNRGVIIVAAAGNNANSVPQYPAACSNVVGVTATRVDDSLAAFSSYGGFAALAAPGENIWTTQADPARPFRAWRGTSFSSPLVAGAAALVASANPMLNNAQIVSILTSTADDLGTPGRDDAFGFGRLNVARAVWTAGSLPGAVAPWTPPAERDPVETPADPPTHVVMSIRVNGAGKVSPNLDGKPLAVGRSYTIKAIPAPGQAFAGWTGAPGAGRILTFVAQTNGTLEANFVLSPFPAVKGTFAGLLADTNGVSPASSGCFTLNVTAGGAFTGKLMLGGKRHGLRGELDVNGHATVSVRRRGQSPLQVSLHVDLSGTDQVEGTVSDGTWSSRLDGDRNVFHRKIHPAAQAGSRAFVLERADEAALRAAAGKSLISPAGNARVKGRLADGRPFSASSVLARNGDYPFYLSLNRGSEVVIGWLNFPSKPAPAAGGTVLWVSTGTNAFAATLQAASVD